MKIGIVSSGNENLYLFSFLQKYEASFDVYCDSAMWPYDDKSFDVVVVAIEKAIETLVDRGCQYVLVSPMYELYFRSQTKYKDLIIPLFSGYLDYAFPRSLVGKFALYGDHGSLEKAQELIDAYSHDYTLTPAQSSTKKFSFPFSWWTKEVPLWNYFLRRLSPREYMVSKVVKFDLHYAKDAAVDTLIPLQYSYFLYQKTIQSSLNQRKQKFHGISVLSDIFAQRFANNDDANDKYAVNVSFTGSSHMLDQNKQLQRLIWKGDRLKKEHN